MDLICLDTNILIDHRRAKDRTQTRLLELSRKYSFAITTISVFELYRGDNSNEDLIWSEFFQKVVILDFNFQAAKQAGFIYRELKSKGNIIGIEDILIASIALVNNLSLATNNLRHFNRIQNLMLV